MSTLPKITKDNQPSLFQQNGLTMKLIQSAYEGMMVSYIRYKVFIDEQAIDVDEEFDGTDVDAYLFLLLKDQQPIGTCRYRIVNNEIIPGRIAILKAFRGHGYGKLMMTWLHTYLDQHYPQETIRIHAQVYLKAFYAQLGYVSVGETFTEAGIIHQEMVRKKA